LQQIIRWW